MKFKNLLWGMALAMFFTSCGGEKTDEGGESNTDSDSTEVATDNENESEEEESSALSGDYSADTENSSIVWTGYQKLKDKAHTGTIDLSDGSLTLEDGSITGGTFTTDMTTITNTDLTAEQGKGDLEKHLKGPDFFDVENNPTGTFEVTSSEGSTVTGDLTIKERTQEVEITDVVIEEAEGGIKVTGKLSFNRAAFEVTYGSSTFNDIKKLGDKLIDDNIDLEISISATAAE